MLHGPRENGIAHADFPHFDTLQLASRAGLGL